MSGKKAKLDGYSLIWITIRADDPTKRVGKALYEKLKNAKEVAKRSIFNRATIHLTESEIATLREILIEDIKDPRTPHSNRSHSSSALAELEKKAKINPAVKITRLRESPVRRRKTPRITPKTPRLRR